MNSNNIDFIKQAAFNDELEKIAGPYTAIVKSLLRKAYRSKGVTGSAYRHVRQGLKGKKSIGTILNSGVQKAQKKWGYKVPEVTRASLKNVDKNGPTTKAFFGAGPKRQPLKLKGFKNGMEPYKYKTFFEQKGLSGKLNWAKERPKAWVGEAASNLQAMKNFGKGSYIKGLPKFMKNEININRTYVHGGKRFKRSALGQVVAPVATTGTAFAGMEFFNKTNHKTGQPISTAGRLGNTSKEFAKWSIAPGFAGTTAIAGMGKSLLG